MHRQWWLRAKELLYRNFNPILSYSEVLTLKTRDLTIEEERLYKLHGKPKTYSEVQDMMSKIGPDDVDTFEQVIKERFRSVHFHGKLFMTHSKDCLFEHAFF